MSAIVVERIVQGDAEFDQHAWDLLSETVRSPIAAAAKAAQATKGAAEAARLAEWEALVRLWPDGTPVTWTAPWGAELRDAYRCPICQQIEVREWHLGISHGMDFADWSMRRCERNWGPRRHCTRLDLLDSQASSLWRRTTCKPRCAACDRPAPTLRGPGDPDGASHCACGCHDHRDCSTPDHCIPLIEELAAQYDDHHAAHAKDQS